MKVSVDFDNTLTRIDVQKFVQKLKDEHIDVYIVTSRFTEESAKKANWHWLDNKDIFGIAEKLKIPKDKIIFTEMKDKIEYLENNDFIFHLDDDEYEIDLIENSDDSCRGVLVKDKNWLEICKKLIL